MADRNLKRSEIEAAQSRYRFPALQQNDPAAQEAALAQSIAAMGILTPLIAHEWQGALHLVDGFKRLTCAEQIGIDSIVCQILPEETDLHAILEIVVHEQREGIMPSVAGRARFLHLAVNLGMSQEGLVNDFLPILGFQAHPPVLKQMLSVAALPEDVLRFCEQKRFSLKQCVHLTGHPRALLAQLFAWRDQLAMSASITEELLDRFGETLHIEEITLEELVRDPVLARLLEVDVSPQERTQRLRAWIRARRFPILTTIEGRMEKARAEMKLPAHITVQWDPALERRELRFHICLKEPREWRTMLDVLNEEPLAMGIGQLFEDL